MPDEVCVKLLNNNNDLLDLMIPCNAYGNQSSNYKHLCVNIVCFMYKQVLKVNSLL